MHMLTQEHNLSRAASPVKEQTLERTLEQTRELDRFFRDVEKRALRMAEIALGNRDEALDVIQDAMLRLAKKYSTKPADEWAPLFYRIVQNLIRDTQRRHTSRHRWLGFLPSFDDNDEDPINLAPDPAGRSPEQHSIQDQSLQQLEVALQALPPRQQQAFLLRNWEGLDVADTAKAMNCSTGSVKTHYSRAVHSLREKLGDYWP